MKAVLSSALVGFLFALGLGISGMTEPQKVVGFLNIFGPWDPSLAFVMIGSILVHSLLYRKIRQRSHPLLSQKWLVPEKTKITPSLVAGSIIFGIGWGLGGYCPGPAITSLASLDFRPIIFVASMIAGMLTFKILDQKVKFNR